MKLDEILQQIGEFGWFQQRTYFLLCLTSIAAAFHQLSWVFLGAEPPHRCILPFDGNGTNASYFLPLSVLNLTTPWDEEANDWSSCYTYTLNWTTEDWTDIVTDREQTVRCQQWIYDTSQYKTSVVSDFNLVCDRSWLQALPVSLFVIGEFFGCLVLGYLADRLGRKKLVFVAVLIQAVIGVLCSLATHLYMFLFLRFLLGISTPGSDGVAFVLGMELVGPSKRTFAGMLTMFFYSFGYILIPVLAYFLREWKYLQIAISLPGFLFILTWWNVPESARWLIAHNRNEEAVKILKQVARINKTTLPKQVLLPNSLTEQTDKPQSNIWKIWKYPKLMKRTINICYNWFVNCAVYYGLSLNTSNLGGDDYVNFLMAGLLEFPAVLFCVFSLNTIGRRLPLMASMCLGGIAMLAIVFTSSEMTVIVIAMMGKFANTISYCIIYVAAVELYPTVVRSGGMGLSTTCAGVGGIIAPFIILLANQWKPLSLLTLGALSLSAGVFSFFLPETRGRDLPETLEDGENFTKSSKNDKDKVPSSSFFGLILKFLKLKPSSNFTGNPTQEEDFVSKESTV